MIFPELSATFHGFHQWMEFAEMSLVVITYHTSNLSANEGHKMWLKTQEKKKVALNYGLVSWISFQK